MIIRIASSLLAVGLLASTAGLTTASADDITLPKNISWTAFGTTSSGYAQSVGIGQMLSNNYGVSLRIIPGENDVSRMIPLTTGQANLCACGIAAYFAQEGVLMFAAKDKGPMRLFNLFNNIGTSGQTAAVAADSGVKSIRDLRGKRVTWIRSSPANNTNMTAFLAFGGLTLDDVTKVEVPGTRQSIEAVINGQADAVWASTVTSALNQLSATPRGVYFPSMPFNDAEGWARAQAIAPWFAPAEVTSFIDGATNEGPYQGMNYPYPLFVGTLDTSDVLAYGLTAAVMNNFDSIKDSGPGMIGYRLDRQALAYIFPYHPAAIRYYEEQGLWTAELQQHNDRLVQRQDVLATAWEQMSQRDVPEEQFQAAWMKQRAAALRAAGLPVVFE